MDKVLDKVMGDLQPTTLCSSSIDNTVLILDIHKLLDEFFGEDPTLRELDPLSVHSINLISELLETQTKELTSIKEKLMFLRDVIWGKG